MDSSRQKSIRVLVVDDQVLYREGLCELMGHWHEFEIIGQASNGQEAVDFCAMRKPDLILMDVQMPVMDGISATAAICSRYPQVRIVMLTVSAEDEHLFGAIQNGAIGYILKDTPARQLRNRLRGIAAGEGSLSGIVAAKVIKEVSSRPIFLRKAKLKPPCSPNEKPSCFPWSQMASPTKKSESSSFSRQAP